MGLLSSITGDLLLSSQGITHKDFSSCGEEDHIQQGTEINSSEMSGRKRQCRMRLAADCLAVTMDPLEQMEDSSEVNVL